MGFSRWPRSLTAKAATDRRFDVDQKVTFIPYPDAFSFERRRDSLTLPLRPAGRAASGARRKHGKPETALGAGLRFYHSGSDLWIDELATVRSARSKPAMARSRGDIGRLWHKKNGRPKAPAASSRGKTGQRTVKTQGSISVREVPYSTEGLREAGS